MCKFKDTNLGIKKLDFNVKRGATAAFLTDGREVIVPISMFPGIKQLSRKQREEWMIWTISTSPSRRSAASIPSRIC